MRCGSPDGKEGRRSTGGFKSQRRSWFRTLLSSHGLLVTSLGSINVPWPEFDFHSSPFPGHTKGPHTRRVRLRRALCPRLSSRPESLPGLPSLLPRPRPPAPSSIATQSRALATQSWVWFMPPLLTQSEPSQSSRPHHWSPNDSPLLSSQGL